MVSKTALIIVDVQNDFLPPDGALAVPGGNEIIPLIKDLMSDAWDWQAVIATQVSGSRFHRSCALIRV
jgi:nicotinamidase-related amidase